MKRKITFLIAALMLLFINGLPLTLKANDGDEHDMGITHSFTLYDTGTLPSDNISAQSYPVKKVTVAWKYNKSIANVATISVSVNGTNWGSVTVGNKTSGNAVFEGASVVGPIVISYSNDIGTGTGNGTLTINSVKLTEGAGASPTVTISSPLNLPATANDNGTINVGYSSITPNGGTIQFYNNSECTGDPITPDWFTATFATTSKATDYQHINYTVTQNDTGSARPVYMKVTLTDGTNSPYAIVSISQYPYYTVTFNGHGGTYNSNTSYTQNIPGGVETALQTNQFVYASHTFTGWNTNENGGGTAYTDGQSVTLTAPLALYAQWAQLYTVTINSMTNGNVTADPSSATAGTEITLTITPDPGYVLDGSVSVKKANNDDVSVSNNKFTMPESNVTVSASFRAAQIYAKYSGSLTEGDYIISSSTNYALSNSYDGTNTRFAGTSISPSSNQVIDPETSIVWHIASSGNSWTIYNTTDSKYVTGTGSASHAGYVTTPSNNQELWTITEVSTGSYTIVNNYNTSNKVNADLRWGGSYWACYAASGSLNLYRKVVNSTMTVDPVENGDISATPTGGSAIGEGGSATVSGGTNVTLSAVGTGSYVLNAWNVYKTGEEGTKVTVTNNSFVMPDYGVTVSASFRLPTKFTVQYSVNGDIVNGLTQSNIPEGNSVTLPNSLQVTPPSGFSYVGWSESETSETVISGSSYTPTDNTTLYLVFVKSGQTAGYNKVTSLDDITAGKYIIVCNNYCLPNVTTTSAPAMSDSYLVSNASGTSNYASAPANTEWIFSGTNTLMTIKNSNGDYLYETSSNNGLKVSSTSDTWSFQVNPSKPKFAMKGANNNRYCALSTNDDWRSYTSKDSEYYYDGGILYLFKKTQTYTRVYNAKTTTMTNIPATSIVTVPSGVTLTLTGTNFGDENNLIINDGGQLITSSTGVKATIKKDIAQATNGEVTNWYLISSPVGTVSTSVVEENDINLYAYNEANLAWNGYESTSYGFDELVSGKGYLYRNSADVTLSFTGTVATPGTVAGISLSCDNEDADFAGFNLLGNPYSRKITSDCISLSDGASFTGVYTLGTDGGWYSSVSADINPCEGFLVKVNKATTATFGAPAKGTTYNNDYIQFTVANSHYEDVTYALFRKGNGLTKINHRNADIPMLYINQNDKDYAIANFNDDTKSFNLNFKAMTTGKYTLSYKTTGEYNYLHVIDRLTGADVDMLVEGEYSFIATPSDNTNRFIVRLEYMPNYSEGNAEIFAFQNGDEVFVSGSGELQIFDVTGRSVMTTTINGAESINLSTSGVYIFRLVGNEVKTQKIVVR